MFEPLQKLNAFYQLLAASALGGAVVKILDVLWNRYVNEWFEKRRLSSSDKRSMADNIIALCAEGNASEYKKLPEDEKKIYLLSNQLESIESKISVGLLEFYNSWVTVATLAGNADVKEDKELLKIMIKEADRRRKMLLRAIGKWKK